MTIFAQKLKPIFFIYCIWFSLCYNSKFSVFKCSAVKVRKKLFLTKPLAPAPAIRIFPYTLQIHGIQFTQIQLHHKYFLIAIEYNCNVFDSNSDMLFIYQLRISYNITIFTFTMFALTFTTHYSGIISRTS